jgi:hypothetical protein
MNISRESDQALHNLLSISQQCINHKPQSQTFSAPSFLRELKEPLTISSMPMETSHVASEMSVLPWNDKIKNFVMDCMSFNNEERFDVCIVLAEYGYNDPSECGDIASLTYDALRLKYSNGSSIILVVEPQDDGTESLQQGLDWYFSLKMTYSNCETTKLDVSGQDLVKAVMPFYREKSTLVLCHDSGIEEYRDLLLLMSDAFWSISCTPTCFVGVDSNIRKCKYMCTVYNHNSSTETRAVGQGMVSFGAHLMPRDYIGKVKYYLKCIRGSKHSTGRCYDCKMLYDVIVEMGAMDSNEEIEKDYIELTDELMKG